MPFDLDCEVLLSSNGERITVRFDPHTEYVQLRSGVVHDVELWFSSDLDRFVGLQAPCFARGVINTVQVGFLLDLLGERLWHELHLLQRHDGHKFMHISQFAAECITGAALHYMLAIGETAASPVG